MDKQQKRLDILLTLKYPEYSRTKASDLIKSGEVSAGGFICKKPSEMFFTDTFIEITGEKPKYVSRGGLKIETLTDNINIDFTGTLCLDAGASTGGFTDFLIQKGAEKIYAVDVGEGQLHKSLQSNPKVVNLPKTDIRNFKTNLLFDFITADLSFISLKIVLPYLIKLLKTDGIGIFILIKPQFELSSRIRLKKGIVRDKKIISETVAKITKEAESLGLSKILVVPSKITGKDGNIEYIGYFKKMSS